MIPSAPGVFPSENLYTNMDYLLSRSNTGGIMEDLARVFPWIIWYIWKVWNEKLFNGRDFSPMDTIDLATRECNAWFLANEEIDPGESIIECIPRTPTEVPTFICRVDGSWKNDETTSGIGWILQLQDGSIDILGLQGCHKKISPLHTELKSLVWALKCLSRHQRYCNYFVTDSHEFVKMIARPEDWPAFAAELNEFKTLWASYQDGQVVYKDRSSNTKAGFLARQARTRKRVFSYVNTCVPHWIDIRNSAFR